MTTKIQIIAEDHLVPVMAHENDAAYDLFANSDAIIRPDDQVLIPTGVTLGLPDGWEAEIVPRSGLAAKFQVTVGNSPGTIDAGYRGEVKVLLRNNGYQEYRVKQYDRIAQMKLKRVEPTQLIQVGNLSATQRGNAGFGSTGRGADVIVKAADHPTLARFMKEELVIDPDTNDPVTVAFFKDEASGGIFAVDSSFIEQLEVPTILEPFNGTMVVLKGV